MPHYAGLTWKNLATTWILLSPAALLVTLWPQYATFGRIWLPILNLLLASSGLLWIVSVTTEFVHAWYSQVESEQFAFIDLYTGPYWLAFGRFGFIMTLAQLFWVRRWRNSWALSVLLILGWFGLSFIVVWQLSHNDYLPSSWPIGKWLSYSLP